MVNNVAFITNNVFITNDLKALTTAANIARASTEALAASTVRLKRTLDLVSRGIANLKGGINTLPTDLTIGVDASAVQETQRELEKLKQDMDDLRNAEPIKIKEEAQKKKEEKEKKEKNITDLISLDDVKSTVKDILKVGEEQKKLRGGINFATNGHGTETVKKVREINEGYGIADEKGLSQFKTFASNTRGKLDAKEQVDSYKGVSAGVSAMGMTEETSQNTFNALAEIANKSIVSAKVFREQLAVNLPDALKIASNAMNLSESDFSRMLNNNELDTKKFLTNFSKEMGTEFGSSATEMSKGMSGQLNLLDNDLLETKRVFSEELEPVLTPILKLFRDLTHWVSKNADLFVPLATGIGVAVIAVTAMTSAQAFCNAVLNANPLMSIFTLFIIVATACYLIVKRLDGWGQSMKGIWEVVKGFTKGVGIAFKEFGQTIWYWVQYAWLKLQDLMEYLDLSVEKFSKVFNLIVRLDFDGAKEEFKKEIITTTSLKLKALEEQHKAEENVNEKDRQAAIAQIRQGIGMIDLKKKQQETTKQKDKKADNGATAGTIIPEPKDSPATKSNEVTGGGLRSIVFNIDTLGVKGGMTVNAQTINEGISNIHDIIVSELNRALDSVGGVVAN